MDAMLDSFRVRGNRCLYAVCILLVDQDSQRRCAAIDRHVARLAGRLGKFEKTVGCSGHTGPCYRASTSRCTGGRGRLPIVLRGQCVAVVFHQRSPRQQTGIRGSCRQVLLRDGVGGECGFSEQRRAEHQV